MTNSTVTSPQWNPVLILLFRLFTSFFILFMLPFPFDVLDFSGTVDQWYQSLWDPVVYWTAQHVLHISYNISGEFNGSGDTTYSYVMLFVVFALALIACAVWSIIDRKRKNYSSTAYWSIMLVRYYLGFIMMSYGFAKIFKTQFPFPFLTRLNEPVGQMSPMGLAWTFMGYSYGFNLFTGFFEALSGFLLFFRKTTTFGALMAITVMSNIVMINFCFDVPVKINSSVYLVMAIFIGLMDAKRIVNFFFLNRDTSPLDLTPVVKKRWMKITRVTLKIALIGFALYSNISGYLTTQTQYGDKAPKPPLYGIYTVATYISGNDTLPPLTTDTTRWSNLTISFPGYATVRRMNDSTTRYSFTPDTVKKTIAIYSYADTTHKYQLTYTIPDTNHLVLCGLLNNDTVCISMNRMDEKKFRLVSRGFHWINEYPYNR